MTYRYNREVSIMTTISAGEMRNRIGDILARIRYAGEHIVIQRKGEPVAAIISFAEYQQLMELQKKQRLEERHRRFARLREAAAYSGMPEEEALALAQEAADSIRHGRGTP